MKASKFSLILIFISISSHLAFAGNCGSASATRTDESCKAPTLKERADAAAEKSSKADAGAGGAREGYHEAAETGTGSEVRRARLADERAARKAQREHKHAQSLEEIHARSEARKAVRAAKKR